MWKEGAAVASGSAYHRKSRIQPIVAALPAASQSEGSRICVVVEARAKSLADPLAVKRGANGLA